MFMYTCETYIPTVWKSTIARNFFVLCSSKQWPWTLRTNPTHLLQTQRMRFVISGTIRVEVLES